MKTNKLLLTISLSSLLCSCDMIQNLNSNPIGNSQEISSSILDPIFSSFLYGKGKPSSDLGDNYSYYYDEETRYVYEKIDNEWINTYSIGGPGLISKIIEMKNNPDQISEMKNSQMLINSLAHSFYSTNITTHLANMTMKRYKNHAGLPTYYDNNGEMLFDIIKYSEDGEHLIYNEDEWKKISDHNPNLFCLIPGVDNIFYTNWGVYQEDLGQLTSIVASNIDKAQYNEEKGTYIIDEIKIEHGELDSYYMTYADKLSFSFEFKLSEDKEYVTSFHFEMLSSTFEQLLEICNFDVSFTDYHNTTLDIPN